MSQTEWTVVTLKEHFEAILTLRADQLDRRAATSEVRFQEHLAEVRQETDVALQASQNAISKSEREYEKRFDSVNEFRAALSDQQKTLLTRAEYATAHQALIDKIDAIDVTSNTAHQGLQEKIANGVSQGVDAREALQKSINVNALEITDIRSRLNTTATNRTVLISAVGLLLTLLIVVIGIASHTVS